MRHVLTLITIVSLVTVGCDDRQQSQTSRQPSALSQPAQQQPKLQAPIIPDDVSYSIFDSSINRGIKRSLDVRLNKKVSERTLRAIALKLKSQDARSYDRTFMAYYLPGMAVGAGAWATTHFNPDLEVRVLGLTAEEEEKLLAEPAPANREIIGRWLDEGPIVGGRITIFREDGKLFIEQIFTDGSSRKEELVEKKSPLGRRFDLKAISSTSDPVRQPDSSPSVSPSQLAKPFPKKQESSQAMAGQQFLKSKLAELDSFKSDPKFHQLGFGIGGPFSSWLKSVESKRDAPDFSFLERVAVGDLEMLGLEYISTKGRENEYTRFARRQITRVMQDGNVELPGDGDHWILGPDENLQLWDNDGLITTAKKIEWGGS